MSYAELGKEVPSQIESGIIQGAVVTSNKSDVIHVFGKQCMKPVPRPMTKNSRFDIASVGKVFTSGCCALLVCDGKLDPDAPLTQYLPEHALGDKCDVTIRDLATHTSGFDNNKPYSPPYGDGNFFNRELFKKLPVRPRNVEFEYSCTNFILLGKVVERISGMGLEEFAITRLWKPLGMKRTVWSAPGAGEDEVEHYSPNRPAGEHNDNDCYNTPFPIGSGSCFSTAEDMLTFCKDILQRKTFPIKYYELITTCFWEKKGRRRSFGWDMSDDARPAGLSKNTIYHSGYTGQTIWVDPDNDFVAVVLTSRTGDWTVARDGRKKIAEILFNSLNQ